MPYQGTKRRPEAYFPALRHPVMHTPVCGLSITRKRPGHLFGTTTTIICAHCPRHWLSSDTTMCCLMAWASNSAAISSAGSRSWFATVWSASKRSASTCKAPPERSWRLVSSRSFAHGYACTTCSLRGASVARGCAAWLREADGAGCPSQKKPVINIQWACHAGKAWQALTDIDSNFTVTLR